MWAMIEKFRIRLISVMPVKFSKFRGRKIGGDSGQWAVGSGQWAVAMIASDAACCPLPTVLLPPASPPRWASLPPAEQQEQNHRAQDGEEPGGQGVLREGERFPLVMEDRPVDKTAQQGTCDAQQDRPQETDRV